MVVARGRSLRVTKYRFALAVRLHHASLIAEFFDCFVNTLSAKEGKNCTSLEVVNHSLLIL